MVEDLNSGVLFADIATNWSRHSRSSNWYAENSETIERSFLPSISRGMKGGDFFLLGELGEVTFPWVSFGAINSGHLFGLDELILFSYYFANKNRYTSFLDLGANVGLHSLVASKLGMHVTAVEPDPTHLEYLSKVISANGLDQIEVIAGAATTEQGPVSFVRVEGNSTGSHVRGAKESPYGVLVEMQVEGHPLSELILNKDLVKMDVEGLEADLLESLAHTDLSSVDILAEIGTEANAVRVFEFSKHHGVNLFSQKVNWSKADSAADLPHHHSEGSVFISASDTMPW